MVISIVSCRVQMLAEPSADERAIALKRFQLFGPRLQDGRELRSIKIAEPVSGVRVSRGDLLLHLRRGL